MNTPRSSDMKTRRSSSCCLSRGAQASLLILIAIVIIGFIGLKINDKQHHKDAPAVKRSMLDRFIDTKSLRSGHETSNEAPPSALTEEEFEAHLQALRDVLIELQSDKDQGFGTHLVALMVAIMNTKGPIFEMGSGKYSTPVMHHLARICGQRQMVTAEAAYKWYKVVEEKYGHADWHEAHWVETFTKEDTSQYGMEWTLLGMWQQWGVVFVDHAGPPGAQRGVDQERMHSHAEVVLGHDANFHAYKFNFTGVQHQFCYKMPHARTATAMGSTTIDITKWFETHGSSEWPTIHGPQCRRVQELLVLLPQYVNPDACSGDNNGRKAAPWNPCDCYSLWLAPDADPAPQKMQQKGGTE